MKNYGLVIGLVIAGLLAGVVIGEFFPKLFGAGFIGTISNAVTDPFSQYRNELAWKYGLIGAGIGLAVGLIIKFTVKKS